MQFAIVILLLRVLATFGSLAKKCQNQSDGGDTLSNASKSCGNVYIWKNQTQDFTSLKNKTYHKARTSDYGALRGKSIRILVTEIYPYILLDKETGQLGGYIGDFWTHLQEMLHFENEIIAEYDYDTALTRMVNGEADIFLGAIVQNKQLDNTTVYSQPYLYNWYQLGFREPEEGGSSEFYAYLFEKDLILASLALYLVFAMTLWGGLKLFNKYARKSDKSNNMSFPSCFIAVFGGFLNQACDLNVKFFSIRVLTFFSLIFGYFLYTAMNSVLISELTSSEIPLPATGLGNTAVTRTHSVCIRNNSFVYNYFLDENKDMLRKWINIANGPGCLDIRNLHNLNEIICNDHVIILENRALMASLFNRFGIKCNFRFWPGTMFPSYNFIVFSKEFEHTILISRCMKVIRTSGILKKLEDKYFKIKASFNFGKSNTAPAVNLHHVSAILGLLVAIMFLSLIILVAEIAYHKINNEKSPSRASIHTFTFIK